MSVETEREWEIHKKLEEISHQQEECDGLQKELADMEEEAHWQNQRIKAVNDDLLESCPKDDRLYQMLLEKEELLRQKVNFEKNFFEDCRDAVQNARNRAEAGKEACEEELESLKAMEGEEEL